MQAGRSNCGWDPRRGKSSVWGPGNPGIPVNAKQVKQERKSPGFQVLNEDFPSLPGTSSGPGGLNSIAVPINTLYQSTEVLATAKSSEQKKKRVAREIVVNPNGDVFNIPPNMVADQFGMAGMLSYLRAKDKPEVISLVVGYDLTKLGVDVDRTSLNLHTSFGGPWANSALPTHFQDKHVPFEYFTNRHVTDKLPPAKFNKYSEDLIFFLFYNCPCEVYQLSAAVELYNRDWRYHMRGAFWVTRYSARMGPETIERGVFYVFDPLTWRKVPKMLVLDHNFLEGPPKFPKNMIQQNEPKPQQQKQQQQQRQQVPRHHR